MRKFRLLTYDRLSAFDFNDSIIAANPTGLGNTFSISYKDTEKGKYLENIRPEFESINLTLYFNADGTTGYANYKRLSEFLTKCGKSTFIFEYDDGITKKFTDVVLKSAPKSEINESGIFAEKFVFERQSYWYEQINESFSFKKNDPQVSNFPLGFPFGFKGEIYINQFKISNKFYEPAPVNITIKGTFLNPVKIEILDTNGNEVSSLELKNVLKENQVLVIDATSKKITLQSENGNENAYYITDKTKQSFLFIPQGDYIVKSNSTTGDNGVIDISIKKYLLD